MVGFQILPLEIEIRFLLVEIKIVISAGRILNHANAGSVVANWISTGKNPCSMIIETNSNFLKSDQLKLVQV